jgi:hypothetical protein
MTSRSAKIICSINAIKSLNAHYRAAVRTEGTSRPN